MNDTVLVVCAAQVTDKPEASGSGVMETEQITSKSRAGCTSF